MEFGQIFGLLCKIELSHFRARDEKRLDRFEQLNRLKFPVNGQLVMRGLFAVFCQFPVLNGIFLKYHLNKFKAPVYIDCTASNQQTSKPINDSKFTFSPYIMCTLLESPKRPF